MYNGKTNSGYNLDSSLLNNLHKIRFTGLDCTIQCNHCSHHHNQV